MTTSIIRRIGALAAGSLLLITTAACAGTDPGVAAAPGSTGSAAAGPSAAAPSVPGTGQLPDPTAPAVIPTAPGLPDPDDGTIDSDEELSAYLETMQLSMPPIQQPTSLSLELPEGYTPAAPTSSSAVPGAPTSSSSQGSPGTAGLPALPPPGSPVSPITSMDDLVDVVNALGGTCDEPGTAPENPSISTVSCEEDTYQIAVQIAFGPSEDVNAVMDDVPAGSFDGLTGVSGANSWVILAFGKGGVPLDDEVAHTAVQYLQALTGGTEI